MKKYNEFLIENLSIDSDLLVTILKSLKSGENQQKVITKILDKEEDKTKKNILMTVVESNDMELIDYMLQFKINLNHKDKDGRNVLFYCKNLNTFKKIYELGADPTCIDIKGRTTLIHLSAKKIFNVELYQKLINDGVDINKVSQGYSVLLNSIKNKKIVELLVKNKVNLNNTDKFGIWNQLCYILRYYNEKVTFFSKLFELLFSNGMKTDDKFFKDVVDVAYMEGSRNVYKFLEHNKRFFDENDVAKIWDNMRNHNYNSAYLKIAIKELMKIFESSTLYFLIKKYWGASFYTEFADIVKEYPWLEDSGKYNL